MKTFKVRVHDMEENVTLILQADDAQDAIRRALKAVEGGQLGLPSMGPTAEILSVTQIDATVLSSEAEGSKAR